MPKINIKDKGNRWEREAAKLLNQRFPDVWKRIPGSGAIGTLVHEPILAADIVGTYSFLQKRVMGECKVGYGGKQMTLHKDWFDHVRHVADGVHGIPVVVLKFEKTTEGVKHVVAMDFETWDYLMGLLEKQNELLSVLSG
jgi:Holliday junction resolvase